VFLLLKYLYQVSSKELKIKNFAVFLDFHVLMSKAKAKIQNEDDIVVNKELWFF